MDDISQRLISRLSACEACGPTSQEQINEAQRRLGLLFPPSYLLFLQTYGAVFGRGLEIAGLPPNQNSESPMWSDTVSSTLMFRESGSLPHDSIYISTDGSDLNYFLLCSPNNSAIEGEVVEWGPDHGGGITCADNFILFLEQRLDR
jgi:hypothetical protein